MYPKTQELIEAFRSEEIFSGVVYAFVGKETEKVIRGYAQTVPEKIPMQEDMLFDVASLTKVVCTTTVVLKLMEKGLVTLDVPLQNYLPAFVNDTITLRHLLTHTSDIQTYIPNRDSLSKEELRSAYYHLQPGEHLGTVVQYTDAGTILLGFMLEEIYQKTAVEIFQEEVLKPLGMSSSVFLPTEVENIVPTEKLTNGVLKGVTHDPKARTLAEHAGNAGLFTNLADLQKFITMLLNEGRVGDEQSLQATTIKGLLQDQTPDGKGGRSLGWDLKYDHSGQPWLFHTGYTGTFLLLDLQQKEAFIFLSNRVHPDDYRELYVRKRDEILKSYFNEKAVAL